MSGNKRERKEFRLPEGLRVDIVQSSGQTGIRWIGRTKDGVPMWAGTWRGLPKWFPWLFKGLGIGLWCLTGIFAAVGMWKAVIGPAIAGSIHVFLGFYLFERFKRQFDLSMTVEEGAEQLGVGVEEFKQAVEERGIKPTHLFNDEPVYSLDSFGEVGVLLRASERPAESERVLMRPAGGPTDANAETLLRPAGEEQIAEPTPVRAVDVSTDPETIVEKLRPTY